MTTAESQASGSQTTDQFSKKDRTLTYIIIGAVALILIAAIVTAVILLLRADPDVTAQIRDVFIIFMALETLLLGLVLVILIIQIALLTNLLQNELKPILESTNETVNTLRGTTAFLSENMVQPVIKMNEYVAALSQLLTVVNLGRRKNKKPQS